MKEAGTGPLEVAEVLDVDEDEEVVAEVELVEDVNDEEPVEDVDELELEADEEELVEIVEEVEGEVVLVVDEVFVESAAYPPTAIITIIMTTIAIPAILLIA